MQEREREAREYMDLERERYLNVSEGTDSKREFKKCRFYYVCALGYFVF